MGRRWPLQKPFSQYLAHGTLLIGFAHDDVSGPEREFGKLEWPQGYPSLGYKPAQRYMRAKAIPHQFIFVSRYIISLVHARSHMLGNLNRESEIDKTRSYLCLQSYEGLRLGITYLYITTFG